MLFNAKQCVTFFISWLDPGPIRLFENGSVVSDRLLPGVVELELSATMQARPWYMA